MSRRIEIELTSQRADGGYTWRAAGAREPRGVIDAAKAGTDAKVGAVLRVEVEVELDGMTILSVLPPKTKSTASNRIEILAPKAPAPGVTTSLVEKRGGSRGDRPGGGRDGRDGRDGREGRGRGRSDRPEFLKRDGTPARPARPERPSREGAEGRRPTQAGPGRPPRDAGGESPGGGDRRPARPATTARTRTRPPRLVEGSAHRDALLAGLPVEQRPIAEQLAIGGLPAVRRALAEEQTAAKAAGRPPVAEAGIVAIAEQLVGVVREAVWLDRAEAAVKQLETISLRDLRAVVAGAAPRDDEGRGMLQQLRVAHDARLTKLRTSWAEEIERALSEGRILQALRLSGRLPEPSARFPAALVEPLSSAASAALSADTPAERWIALLEAAVASPVRRMIKPAGLPADDSGTLRQAAAAAAGRIPALAPLLGLPMPPPPGPPGAKPVAPRRPAKPHSGRAPIPPPPPAARTAAPDRPATEAAPAPADAVTSGPAPEEAPAPESTSGSAAHGDSTPDASVLTDSTTSDTPSAAPAGEPVADGGALVGEPIGDLPISNLVSSDDHAAEAAENVTG
jgi:hypothetical protein